MTDFPQPADQGVAPAKTPSKTTLPPMPISGPLSLGELMDRAFRLYRNHFGLLLLTAAIFLVPLGLVTGVFTGNFIVGYLDLVTNLPNVIESTGGNPAFDEILPLLAPIAGLAGFYLVLMIASFLLQGLVTLCLTAHTLAFLRAEVLTVGESIAIGFRRLGAYVGKSIVQGVLIAVSTLGVLMLFGCAAFAIAMTVGGVSFFNGSFEPQGDLSPVLIFGLFATIFCLYLFAILFMLVPTIYLSARYVTATVGLVDQAWGPVESLRKSWALTTGRTWRCIGYVFLLTVLTAIIINVPIAVVQNVVTAFIDLEMLGFYSGLFAGATALMGVLWQPFYVAAIVLFYVDLRVRQEDYDLELRLQQLEGLA